MGLADELARLDETALARRAQRRRVPARQGQAARWPASPPDIPAVDAINRWRRSRSDRWIGGVCGGLAVITGVESWIWRLILFALALFGGTGVLLYILLWIFVPNE